MQEQKRTEETIKIVFSSAPGYRVVAANGVWGGLTPRGELKMDFIVDSLRTPDLVAHSIKPDGGLGDEIRREPAEGVLFRELQIGILLPIGHAESIAKWMLDKVKEFNDQLKLKQEREKGKEGGG